MEEKGEDLGGSWKRNCKRSRRRSWLKGGGGAMEGEVLDFIRDVRPKVANVVVRGYGL